MSVKTCSSTANARFKAQECCWFWAAVCGSVAVHFLVFTIGPVFTVRETGSASRGAAMQVLRVISVSIEAPSRPRALAPREPAAGTRRVTLTEQVLPAVPTATLTATLEALQSIVLPTVTFAAEAPGMPRIDPPPAPPGPGEAELVRFTHVRGSMEEPELANRAEVTRALKRGYSRALQAAEIRGVALFWIWIDETGTTRRYELRRSSGSGQLDEAASDVIAIMKFKPAKSSGAKIAVIVAQPIHFALD